MVKKYIKPKWGVYEGDILRAAQSTKRGASKYMKPNRRLVKLR